MNDEEIDAQIIAEADDDDAWTPYQEVTPRQAINRNPMLKVTSLISFAIVLVLMSGTLFYAFQNDSGHMGPNPSDIAPLFFLFTIFGLLFFGLGRKTPFIRSVGLATAQLGVLGVTFLYQLESLEILVSYQTWIEKGMPVNSAYRMPLLIGYALLNSLTLAILGRTLWKTRLKSNPLAEQKDS